MAWTPPATGSFIDPTTGDFYADKSWYDFYMKGAQNMSYVGGAAPTPAPAPYYYPPAAPTPVATAAPIATPKPVGATPAPTAWTPPATGSFIDPTTGDFYADKSWYDFYKKGQQNMTYVGGAAPTPAPTAAPAPTAHPVVSNQILPTSSGSNVNQDILNYAHGLDWTSAGSTASMQALQRQSQAKGWTNDQIGAALGFTGQQVADGWTKYGSPAPSPTPAPNSSGLSSSLIDTLNNAFQGSGDALYLGQDGYYYSPIGGSHAATSDGGETFNDPISGYTRYKASDNPEGKSYDNFDLSGNKTGTGTFDHVGNETLLAFLATAAALFTGGASLAALGSSGSAAAAGGAASTGAGFIGEGALSGIPAWDGALASAAPGVIGGSGVAAGVGSGINPASAGGYVNGADAMSDAFAQAGGQGAGGFGGGSGAAAGIGAGAHPASAGNYVNGSDLMSDNFTQAGGQGVGGFGGGSGAAAAGIGSGASSAVPSSSGGSPGPVSGTSGGVLGTGLSPGQIAGGAGTLANALGGGGSNTTGGSGSGSSSSTAANLAGLLSLLGGGLDAHNQNSAANSMLDYLKSRQAINDNMYKPGSDEYNSLWDEMSRKDAAAGRNSQYGPRSVDLAARIAGIKEDNNTKLTSSIGNLYANALNKQASAPAGLLAALQGGGGSSLLSTLSSLFGSGGSGGGSNNLSSLLNMLTSNSAGNGNAGQFYPATDTSVAQQVNNPSAFVGGLPSFGPGPSAGMAIQGTPTYEDPSQIPVFY